MGIKWSEYMYLHVHALRLYQLGHLHDAVWRVLETAQLAAQEQLLQALWIEQGEEKGRKNRIRRRVHSKSDALLFLRQQIFFFFKKKNISKPILWTG